MTKDREVGQAPAARRGRSASKRKSLADLNAWLTANHDRALEKARQNCLRLTGKPTFGGTKRRQSA